MPWPLIDPRKMGAMHLQLRLAGRWPDKPQVVRAQGKGAVTTYASWERGGGPAGLRTSSNRNRACGVANHVGPC